ncbi:non-functional NADPH-dependent codeinone reductase 2 isoform X2 [Jatropha curcas]|uniref:non-functional NADPH-dependent codeinone reductase 2 isoform X2 n=1 Tax=Jatropha curcas TaxID=180498 RepID=UPI0009D79A82|nr:non-functional NADPH-dependent codeinone reductase 2 isoform X2 [Jatropha curcas]
MSLISKTKEEKRTQNFLLRKKKMDINSRITIPEVLLSSSSPRMKLLGMGTATFPRVPSKETKEAILEAIKIGYRHFDTASLYQTEEPLGQAIAEALSIGLIKSRKELFITSKLWSSDAHSHLFLTALQKSLWALQLDYIDLYLIHLPVSCKPGIYEFPVQREDFLPMDFKGVWTAMEECQKLGFTKSIGWESCWDGEKVEINPLWQQKLMEFCKGNGITLTAYAAVGAGGTIWGSNRVMENEVLNKIAKAKGVTVAQCTPILARNLEWLQPMHFTKFSVMP